jgi:hypothetical protein
MQQEYSERTQIPIQAVAADSDFYETTSYNDKYRKIIVKEGINPIAPPNSEIISQITNPNTNTIILVCGIFAEGNYQPPITKKENITIENSIIERYKEIKQQETDTQPNTTIQQSVEYGDVKTESDAMREQARQTAEAIVHVPALIGGVESFQNLTTDNYLLLLIVIVVIVAIAAYTIKIRGKPIYKHIFGIE